MEGLILQEPLKTYDEVLSNVSFVLPLYRRVWTRLQR